MIIGAHYYPWYKDNWGHKTVRGLVNQTPSLGWYNNKLSLPLEDKAKIFITHCEWCKKYGIDFLVLSYNGIELIPYLDIAEAFDIKITIHYETLMRTKTEKLSETDCPKLITDFNNIKYLFKHKSWLKIEDKPVISYYVSRQIEKQALSVFKKIRECYPTPIEIWGDEIWWNEPDHERIQTFDAIFAYNMYISKNQPMVKGLSLIHI